MSLEMREEQRRFSLAMAIVLDRSGSMAAPCRGGPTKMDLANRGAIAAIELLTPLDSVAVVAVDSEPHVVVPLRRRERPVRDRRAACAASSRWAAASSWASASHAARAAAREGDAGDEAPRAVRRRRGRRGARRLRSRSCPRSRAAGITVSVIGLGSASDPDAALLREIARLGGGRVFFARDAKDLPRIFAQETIEVARSAFVEEPCAVATLPDLATLGALRGVEFPSVGGYTIAYLKPGASAGLRTKDETAAPLFSFRQAGLGRAAAFLGVADGSQSGDLATWDGYADFFSTIVRWTAGTDAADEVHATAARRGHEGVLVVEVPRGRDDLLARLDARVADPSGAVRRVDLVRTGATRAEGRFPLAATGVHRPVIDAGTAAACASPRWRSPTRRSTSRARTPPRARRRCAASPRAPAAAWTRPRARSSTARARARPSARWWASSRSRRRSRSSSRSSCGARGGGPTPARRSRASLRGGGGGARPRPPRASPRRPRRPRPSRRAPPRAALRVPPRSPERGRTRARRRGRALGPEPSRGTRALRRHRRRRGPAAPAPSAVVLKAATRRRPRTCRRWRRRSRAGAGTPRRPRRSCGRARALPRARRSLDDRVGTW